MPRLAHRHGLTSEEIAGLVDTLSIQAEVIDPLAGVGPDLRDLNDQPGLNTLRTAPKTSSADYLITVTRICW